MRTRQRSEGRGVPRAGGVRRGTQTGRELERRLGYPRACLGGKGSIPLWLGDAGISTQEARHLKPQHLTLVGFPIVYFPSCVPETAPTAHRAVCLVWGQSTWGPEVGQRQQLASFSALSFLTFSMDGQSPSLTPPPGTGILCCGSGSTSLLPVVSTQDWSHHTTPSTRGTLKQARGQESWEPHPVECQISCCFNRK